MIKTIEQVLHYIYSSRKHVAFTDDVIDFIGDNGEEHVVILIGDGLIINDEEDGREILRLTAEGDKLLSVYHEQIQKEAQKIAEQKERDVALAKERRKDRRLNFIITILTLICGWVLGSVTPREVGDFFLGIFR